MDGNGRGCVAGALAAPGRITPRTEKARVDEGGWLPGGTAPVNHAGFVRYRLAADLQRDTPHERVARERRSK